MTVVFQTPSKEQNRFVITPTPYGKLYFMKGVYMTESKEIIEYLLGHPLYKRGEYELITNPEVVDNYLSGEEADKLTKEILDEITIDGIIKLGEVLGARNKKATLIKAEIVGEPITNAVQDVIDFYTKVELPKKETIETESKIEFVEPEKEVIEIKQSIDFTAKDAIDYINGSTPDSLEGFVPEEEDRKTVLSAYEEKIN